MTTTTSSPARAASKLAIPFLGLVAGLQGAMPNIASTALVGASRSLDMTGSTQALAASAQTLAIAATVISAGLLADRLGRRNVLMVALVVATVGNIIVALAPASTVYIIGMAVTGAGLGAVFGCAFAYIKAVSPPERLAASMGLFTASNMAVTVILTFVGGSLTSIDWRVAFVLLPVIATIVLLLVPVVLPRQKRVTGTNTDLPGQLFLFAGVFAFLYSCSQFATSLTSPKTLIPLIAGVVFLAGFFIWESRSSRNFFPVELFRSPVFLAALAAGFIFNFGNAVAFLQVTNLWQYVTGLKTSEVALWQLPLLLAGIVAGVFVGRLMVKGLTNRLAIVIGGLTTAAGFAALALAHSSTSFLAFLPGLLLVGGGVVLAAVPFGNLILRESPPQYLGPVSSSRTTAGQFFYTLGFSLSTVLIDRMTDGGVVQRLTEQGVPANQLSTGLDAVSVYASTGTAPSTSFGQQALADAVTSYGNAFSVTMFVSAGVLLLAALAAFLWLRNGEGTPQPASTEEPSPAAA